MYNINVFTITTSEFKLGFVSDVQKIKIAKRFISDHLKNCTDQDLVQMAIDNHIRVCVLEQYKEDSVIPERMKYLLEKQNLLINEDTFEVALFLMDPDHFAAQVGVPKEELLPEDQIEAAVQELLG